MSGVGCAAHSSWPWEQGQGTGFSVALSVSELVRQAVALASAFFKAEDGIDDLEPMGPSCTLLVWSDLFERQRHAD